jgi:hypothetical protein
MEVDVRNRTWFSTAGILTLAFLALALGLCTLGGFHDTPLAHHGTGTHHGTGSSHGMSPDLCAGLLLTSAAVLLLAGLLPGQWLRPQGPAVAYLTSPARLDHPPRFIS